MIREDVDDVDDKESIYLRKRSVGTAGHRKNYRHPVHWRVAIVHKKDHKNDIYHGKTNDISLWGASILVDHNFFVMSEVVMLLAIPPINIGQKETIVEIQCSMAYTVLDSEHSQFRLGMRFLRFKGEGKRILSDVLSKRVIPKSEKKSYGTG